MTVGGGGEFNFVEPVNGLAQTGEFKFNTDLTNISGYKLSSFATESTKAGDTVVISWSTDDECILVDGKKPTPANPTAPSTTGTQPKQ